MKVKIFIVGITIVIIGVTLQFMKSVAGFPEWLSYAGMPVMFAGVYCAIMFGIDWNRPSPHIPLKKIEKDVLIEYFNNRLSENTVRLFVSDDRMTRVLICREDGAFGIVSEMLMLCDEDELQYSVSYGRWVPSTFGFKGVYDSVETALKENKDLIEGMNEVLLPLPPKPKIKIKFIRPKKFSAGLQKVQFRVDGNYYLIKNGQTVEVEADSGMHIIALDGNSYLLENLNTYCEFSIKAHCRFAGGAYFTLEMSDNKNL